MVGVNQSCWYERIRLYLRIVNALNAYVYHTVTCWAHTIYHKRFILPAFCVVAIYRPIRDGPPDWLRAGVEPSTMCPTVHILNAPYAHCVTVFVAWNGQVCWPNRCLTMGASHSRMITEAHSKDVLISQ